MVDHVTASILTPVEDLEAEGPSSAPVPRLDEAAPAHRELPRLLAVWSDAESSEEVALAHVWLELCARRARVTDGFFTDQRCYLLLEKAIGGDFGPPLTDRQAEVLERVLVGQTQKAISIDLALSAPRIAQAVSSALRALGLCCKSSGLPMLLAMAAHGHQAECKVLARASRLKWAGETYYVISTPRPDRALKNRLSESEYAVACLLVEGKTHAEISQLRGTSTRTVANQLSTLFHKLKISGRAELLALLAREAAGCASAKC